MTLIASFHQIPYQCLILSLISTKKTRAYNIDKKKWLKTKECMACCQQQLCKLYYGTLRFLLNNEYLLHPPTPCPLCLCLLHTFHSKPTYQPAIQRLASTNAKARQPFVQRSCENCLRCLIDFYAQNWR